jgi:hypothetical protein
MEKIISFRTRPHTVGEWRPEYSQLVLWHNLLLLAAIGLALYNLSAAIHL